MTSPIGIRPDLKTRTQYGAWQPGKARGFTLVEVCITVAILAIAAAVVIPAMNNLSRAHLRQAASAMAATIRGTYDDAILTGEIHRLVLTPGQSTIQIETTTDTLRLDAQQGAFVTAAQMADKSLKQAKNNKSKIKSASNDQNSTAGPHRLPQRSNEEAPPSLALMAFSQMNQMADQASGEHFDSTGVLHLADGVKVLDFWSEGIDHTIQEGQAYLYFFPHGYTQEAVIHLQDTEKRIFTLQVAPLTGQAVIVDHRVEPHS